VSGTVRAAPPALTGLTYLKDLGVGGYSQVYLYEQHMPKMRVAVKVLRAEVLTERVRRQFTEEANAMAELADHPNIVQVLRADISGDGRPYLVMKYYPRENLRERAARERFPVADVLSIGVQIAGAVHTAHSIGILHRDIKPANILTGPYDEPALTDFGIAARAVAGNVTPDDDAEEALSLPWSPPEVLADSSQSTVAADVYSLSATLWHLLVGRSPFEIPGGDNRAFATVHRIQTAERPRTGRPEVPPSLESLLRQGMSRQPEQRPESALALARALQAIEIEQRLSPTRIRVAVETPEPPAAPKSRKTDDGDRTRTRGPQRLAAQPPVTTSTPSFRAPRQNRPVSPSPPEPASREREPVRQRVLPADPRESATVRRPTTAAPESPAPDQDAPRRGPRLLIALGAVVVGAVVVGVLVTRGPSPEQGTTNSSKSTQSNDGNAVLAQPAPGPAAIKYAGTKSGKATFTWTYDNPLAGDTFRWEVVGKDPQTVNVPTLAVPVPASGAVCIQVQVVRSDGSNASRFSDPGCTTS
jgi:serine/threonine protein kinase